MDPCSEYTRFQKQIENMKQSIAVVVSDIQKIEPVFKLRTERLHIASLRLEEIMHLPICVVSHIDSPQVTNPTGFSLTE